MKYNIGNDVVKISRFNDKINNGAFIESILSDNDLLYFDNIANEEKILFLAKKWSIIESLSKIDQKGIASIKKYAKYDLITEKNKKPYLRELNVDISFSHDDDYLYTSVVKEIDVS